jgi:hypothetical protein
MDTQRDERSSAWIGGAIAAIILAFFICGWVFHLVGYRPDDLMFLSATAVTAGVLLLLIIFVDHDLLMRLAIYIGIAAAVLIFWHPPPIGDVPLARLTLSAIVENAAKLLVLAGLVVGFFQTLTEG